MLSAKQQLIYEGGADSMEQECVCAEEGLRGGSAANCRRRSGWRWLQRAAQLLVVALLLLLCVVLVLLVIVGLERNKPTHYDEQDRQPRVDTDRTGQNNKQESTLEVQHQIRGDTPRAMLTVSDNQTSEKTLQWQTEIGNAFLGGFSYVDDHLVVPRNGLYRVFLQVTFLLPKCEIQVLSCTVSSWADEYRSYVQILQTQDFVEHNNDTVYRKTLYTSALFRFSNNTKLKVETNKPGFVSVDEKLVFFGAELLAD